MGYIDYICGYGKGCQTSRKKDFLSDIIFGFKNPENLLFFQDVAIDKLFFPNYLAQNCYTVFNM